MSQSNKLKLISSEDNFFLSVGLKEAQELLDNSNLSAFVLVTVDKDGLPGYHQSSLGRCKTALIGAMDVVKQRLIADFEI